MIDVINVSKKFKKREVLKDVSFSLNKGEATVLMGPNGCGKTTLLRIILGLVIKDQGSVSVNGIEIKDHYEYRRSLGYMPQVPAFPENLTPRELFNLMTRLKEKEPIYQDEYVYYLGVEDYLDSNLDSLSGGTKQKISFILATMFDDDMIILDEPTAGLDPLAIIKFKKIFSELKERGKTILLTTHITSEAEELCDNLVFLNDGEVLVSKPLVKFLDERDAFTLEDGIVSLFKGKI